MKDLIENGFKHFLLDLDDDWKNLATKKSYSELEQKLMDDLRLNLPIKKLVSQVYSSLKIEGAPVIEHMLALRAGPEDPELDGIWHDDSSRHFAISLSLSLEHTLIEGGELEIRRFNQEEDVTSLPGSRPFAQASVFLTGKYGFEHRTRRVTAGNRLVLVLWVSQSEASE